VPFSGVTTGSNATALTIGTGGSLTTSGTGTNNANRVNGATVPTSATSLATNSSGQIIAGSGGGGSAITMGGTISGTIPNSSNQSTLYLITDGSSVTLPATPITSQEIILIDSGCSASNTGFTLNANTSVTAQSIFAPNNSGVFSGTSVLISCDIHLVYDTSNHVWYGIGVSI
jgi:hypothetical protein